MVLEQLFEVSGEQFLLECEPYPRPGAAHVCAQVGDLLNVPAQAEHAVTHRSDRYTVYFRM